MPRGREWTTLRAARPRLPSPARVEGGEGGGCGVGPRRRRGRGRVEGGGGRRGGADLGGRAENCSASSSPSKVGSGRETLQCYCCLTPALAAPWLAAPPASLPSSRPRGRAPPPSWPPASPPRDCRAAELDNESSDAASGVRPGALRPARRRRYEPAHAPPPAGDVDTRRAGEGPCGCGGGGEGGGGARERGGARGVRRGGGAGWAGGRADVRPGPSGHGRSARADLGPHTGDIRRARAGGRVGAGSDGAGGARQGKRRPSSCSPCGRDEGHVIEHGTEGVGGGRCPNVGLRA